MLRLPRPDLVCNCSHELELLPHILMAKRIALGMACEPTLRRHSELIERLLSTLSSPLRYKIRRLLDPLDHVLLLLELGKLGRYDSEDHVLILGKMLQRLESACSGSIVLEIESVAIQGLCGISRQT